jgi:hypothetical protein
VRIFVEIEHVINRGVIFWPERIRQLFPTLWSGHKIWPILWPNSWPLHSVWNSCPILLAQNATPHFPMCSIPTIILTGLANLFGIIIQFSRKASVMTVATIPPRSSVGVHQESMRMNASIGLSSSRCLWSPYTILIKRRLFQESLYSPTRTDQGLSKDSLWMCTLY